MIVWKKRIRIHPLIRNKRIGVTKTNGGSNSNIVSNVNSVCGIFLTLSSHMQYAFSNYYVITQLEMSEMVSLCPQLN